MSKLEAGEEVLRMKRQVCEQGDPLAGGNGDALHQGDGFSGLPSQSHHVESPGMLQGTLCV